MNYQNYQTNLDSPSSGQGSNPRQVPASPSSNMNHASGINGGMGLGAGMAGFPTPAGHQSDLNYIMQMVEDLSGILAHNQRKTSGLTEKIGMVRAKAKNMNLTNDELLAMAASEINRKLLQPFHHSSSSSILNMTIVETDNLEKEISELRKKLSKAEYDRDENWKLVVHGCDILRDILEKMHKFREQHDHDVNAWHKNYRKQLADEREENMNLRNQINEMKAAAARANEHLRGLRRYLTDHDELHELRVENHRFRLERRFWKRMAMPLIPDDDAEWSDDDDLIDVEEKKRLAADATEKARKDAEGGEGGDGDDGQASAIA